MDEIALIRALAAGEDRPDPAARAAARQALDAGFGSASPDSSRQRRDSSPRRRFIALGGAVALATAALVVLFAVGEDSGSPQRAYGAKLVSFAESTPLLLLEGPGWQVRNVVQWQHGSGSMEFGPGPAGPAEPHPSRREIIQREARLPIVTRAVKLSWAPWARGARGWLGSYQSHGFTITAPVLGTVAHIDPNAESSIAGAGGRRWMIAIWKEGGRVLSLSAWVPDLAAFRERLGWLQRVDAQSWLDAMPQRVVKAADYGAEVREMLQGIPLPAGFDPSKIPNRDVTTNRYSVGKAVGGAVACEWFSRWFDARAAHDVGAAREARQTLLRSGSWPVFRRITTEGSYPQLVVEFAEALPSGRWGHDRPLRQIINSGCTEIGFPLGLR
jgi:hypothetical protein